MTKTKLKITGLILALMMLISMFGMFSITAFAVESDYPYAVEDTETGIITIDGTLGGKTEATEADMEELASFLESSINKGKTSFIVTGENQAIYAYTAESRYPVVGFAIAQMPYDHNGTIDVIYRDATELLKEELAVCCSLRTVALPNVSNCGDDAFSDCYYLENLEFGSVVTSVGEDAFHDVDRYVDGGCELVLNCGQMQTESYKPNLDTSEWAGHTWKSITLTHTPEADDGDCTTPILCSTCGEIAEEGKESHTTTEESNKATCTTKAVCDLCGTEYGEPAPNAHSFVDGKCACGMKQFDFYGQQLNIGGDLSMKYYVTALSDGVSTETLTMEFLFLGKKTEVSGVYDSETRMYVFTLDGINPQCMGDAINATLLLNGEAKASKNGYTVEQNLLNLLAEYPNDEALKTLVNDILAYGEAASEYKNHDSMTNDYEGSDREIPETTVTPNDVIIGYTVRFGTTNSIIIKVDPNAFANDLYQVYCNGKALSNYKHSNSNQYAIHNISATDFDKEWEFVVRSNNPMGAVYGSITISVNDYLYSISQSATATAEMKALAKALYNYGVSAEVHNHVANGVGEHTYTYIDNGDGTHDKVCTICSNVNNEAHDYVNGKCVCGKYEVTIDLSTLNATYVINDNKYYEFIGSGNYGIKVESGNPTIVLNDASIMVGEGSAIDVASGSNATIFVLGDNTIGTIDSWNDVPSGGIFVAEGGTVNITSNGTDNILRARGTLAAAIGGKYDYDNNESYNAGSINISNVTVYAYTNNFYASAIGAAGEGTCGTINITNAVIYAYGAGDRWTSAPGIGNAWSLLDWSDTIPIVIISDSEVHTFRYNPYSDYIGYLGDESGDTYATGSINCGEGGSVKSSTIYCYTGLDATTTDKVVTYDADGNPTEN